MSRWFWRIVAVLFWLGPLGCSNVKFKSSPNPTCQQYAREFGPGGCVLNPDGIFSFNYSVTTGEVDILFVDDNSGSMYTEQTEMANRFPGFLDSIYRLDYRLAMITTDITANGGGFLSFPNGQKTIANSSRQQDATHQENIDHFQKTIKRPETLTCDSSGYQSCPSGDERGIYALNLAIERSDQRSFFRSGGHLAVVILSDEDERSNGGNIAGHPLEALDKPLSFVQRAKQFLGATKTVSVHSIIIRPGDSGCHTTQNSQANVRGDYGYSYAELSEPSTDLKNEGPIVDGVLGSICSNNYTTELGDISAKLKQHLEEIQLPCSPLDGDVKLSYEPSPGPIVYSIDSTNRLHLNPVAPVGTKVNLSYRCKL